MVKGHIRKLAVAVDAEPRLKGVTPKEILRKAAQARNVTVTFGGKTPVEIAYGRRPPDIVDVETSDPTQISTELSKYELTDIELGKLARRKNMKMEFKN